MKRLTLSAITLAFIAYLLVVASTQNLFGINQFKSISNRIGYGRKLTGIGALFTRESTLVNYQMLYKIHKNGKWSTWHFLEQETFRAYTKKADISELRHSRLDAHLTKDLYFSAYRKNKDIRPTLAYQTLISHLVKGHFYTEPPDSIQLVFQRKSLDSMGKTSLLNLFYFKESL